MCIRDGFRMGSGGKYDAGTTGTVTFSILRYLCATVDESDKEG